MRKILMGLALFVATAAAAAQAPDKTSGAIEASMLVTGTIDVETDGSVSGHVLDKADALPAVVTAMLGEQIPKWRFEPVIVDGQAVPARVPASIRLVAREVENDRFGVHIGGAHFTAAHRGSAHGEYPIAKHTDRRAPAYPPDLLRAGAGATVYLLLKVGPDGKVEDQIAEQVNLTVVARERQMAQMRNAFARASLTAARTWTFPRPDGVEIDADGSWSVRVPVDFVVVGQEAAYGEWQAYVPGPRQANPWSDEDDGVSPETLAANGTYPVGLDGPKLLTPLQAGEG